MTMDAQESQRLQMLQLRLQEMEQRYAAFGQDISDVRQLIMQSTPGIPLPTHQSGPLLNEIFHGTQSMPEGLLEVYCVG